MTDRRFMYAEAVDIIAKGKAATVEPKPMPTYSPPCICTHTYDTSGRFPVWRITTFERECLQHGYLFRVNLAADLRYSD